MSVQPATASTVSDRIVPFGAMNGIAVATLYSAQAILGQAALAFDAAPLVRCLPGFALAGYAIGVALLAALVPNLTSARGLGIHTGVLTVGLVAVAVAPDVHCAAIAFLLVGLGCSLTQRLLACAAAAVPAERRSRTIGLLIATGLCGIIVARAAVPAAAALFGWRPLFWLTAMLAAGCGIAAMRAASRIDPGEHRARAGTMPTVLSLWRGAPVLRRAALQQAAVFAAFNGAWAAYPVALSGTSTTPLLSMGIVASVGAAAAIVSGRLCGHRDPAIVAGVGLGAVLLASAALFAAGFRGGICSADMAVLEIGTQMALVANQSRAQALGLSPAIRGRLAAIVTTVGFSGGALGAAIGNVIA